MLQTKTVCDACLNNAVFERGATASDFSLQQVIRITAYEADVETVERIRFTVTVVRNSTLLENLVELIDQRNYS